MNFVESTVDPLIPKQPVSSLPLSFTHNSITADVLISKFHSIKLEMWANAQPDGRPAEYRWRPLFNAAQFG